jgi:hypothetical protein
MRHHVRPAPAAIAAFALLAAGAAGAQRLGERTTPAETMLQGLSQGAGYEAEIGPQAAAAAAHPLGSAANPVRVGGPEGERAYLARLRCADGTSPAIGAREEGGVGAYGSVVGGYRLDCAGGVSGRVLFDIYHAEHQETAAPAGFTLAR